MMHRQWDGETPDDGDAPYAAGTKTQGRARAGAHRIQQQHNGRRKYDGQNDHRVAYTTHQYQQALHTQRRRQHEKYRDDDYESVSDDSSYEEDEITSDGEGIAEGRDGGDDDDDNLLPLPPDLHAKYLQVSALLTSTAANVRAWHRSRSQSNQRTTTHTRHVSDSSSEDEESQLAHHGEDDEGNFSRGPRPQANHHDKENTVYDDKSFYEDGEDGDDMVQSSYGHPTTRGSTVHNNKSNVTAGDKSQLMSSTSWSQRLKGLTARQHKAPTKETSGREVVQRTQHQTHDQQQNQSIHSTSAGTAQINTSIISTASKASTASSSKRKKGAILPHQSPYISPRRREHTNAKISPPPPHSEPLHRMLGNASDAATDRLRAEVAEAQQRAQEFERQVAATERAADLHKEEIVRLGRALASREEALGIAEGTTVTLKTAMRDMERRLFDLEQQRSREAGQAVEVETTLRSEAALERSKLLEDNTVLRRQIAQLTMDHQKAMDDLSNKLSDEVKRREDIEKRCSDLAEQHRITMEATKKTATTLQETAVNEASVAAEQMLRAELEKVRGTHRTELEREATDRKKIEKQNQEMIEALKAEVEEVVRSAEETKSRLDGKLKSQRQRHRDALEAIEAEFIRATGKNVEKTRGMESEIAEITESLQTADQNNVLAVERMHEMTHALSVLEADIGDYQQRLTDSEARYERCVLDYEEKLGKVTEKRNEAVREALVTAETLRATESKIVMLEMQLAKGHHGGDGKARATSTSHSNSAETVRGANQGMNIKNSHSESGKNSAGFVYTVTVDSQNKTETIHPENNNSGKSLSNGSSLPPPLQTPPHLLSPPRSASSPQVPGMPPIGAGSPTVAMPGGPGGNGGSRSTVTASNENVKLEAARNQKVTEIASLRTALAAVQQEEQRELENAQNGPYHHSSSSVSRSRSQDLPGPKGSRATRSHSHDAVLNSSSTSANCPSPPVSYFGATVLSDMSPQQHTPRRHEHDHSRADNNRQKERGRKSFLPAAARISRNNSRGNSQVNEQPNSASVAVPRNKELSRKSTIHKKEGTKRSSKPQTRTVTVERDDSGNDGLRATGSSLQEPPVRPAVSSVSASDGNDELSDTYDEDVSPKTLVENALRRFSEQVQATQHRRMQ